MEQKQTTILMGLILSLVPLLIVGLPSPASLSCAHWILLWGVAVVAPLALRLTRLPGGQSSLFNVLQRTLPGTGLLMALGWLWQGVWLIVGSGAWLLTTFGLAAWGLARFRRRSDFCVAETTRDIGLMYAPIGGIWTFAYAWQRGLMGFDPTMTLLTGDHFCYVTLGAMQWAGLSGRQSRSRLFPALAALLWVSPAIVAAGITYTHHAGHPTMGEVIGVTCQVLATSGTSLLWLASPPQRRQFGLVISALCSLLTMALALNYGWGSLFHWRHLDLAWMIPYHGLVNALGYVTLGLLCWQANPTARPLEG